MYGALRAGRDLLSGAPDLVVIEFAVNDNWTDGEAYEGLVRQILAQPNHPPIHDVGTRRQRPGDAGKSRHALPSTHSQFSRRDVA